MHVREGTARKYSNVCRPTETITRTDHAQLSSTHGQDSQRHGALGWEGWLRFMERAPRFPAEAQGSRQSMARGIQAGDNALRNPVRAADLGNGLTMIVRPSPRWRALLEVGVADSDAGPGHHPCHAGARQVPAHER